MASARTQASQGARSRDVGGSTAKTPATPPPGSVTVWATTRGFYGGNRIRAGQAFTIASLKDFSAKWMRRTDPAAAKATGPSSDPGVEAGSGEPPTGAANPIGG